MALMQQRGEVLFLSDIAPYEDEMRVPGLQLFISLADGRLLRVHVYVVRNRLYVTEATSQRNDSTAFRFEESVAFIDETGRDLDSNNLPPRGGTGFEFRTSGTPICLRGVTR